MQTATTRHVDAVTAKNPAAAAGGASLLERMEAASPRSETSPRSPGTPTLLDRMKLVSPRPSPVEAKEQHNRFRPEESLSEASDRGDTVAVQFLGTTQLPDADGLFDATYTEYSFKIESANGLDARIGRDGHMFRTRYSKARAAHAQILKSDAAAAFSGESNAQLVAFPAGFPLRDMTTEESVQERAEELRVYYQYVLSIEGALAVAEVRRAVSLAEADEVAVLYAAGLYFVSVGPLKARFAELCALHWGDDEGLRAPFPLARVLGVDLLRQSRRDVEEQCSSAQLDSNDRRLTAMSLPQSEATTTSDDLERHVDMSLRSVVTAEQGQSGDSLVVDWASFESWWKVHCLKPIAAAARRALLPLAGTGDAETKKEVEVAHELVTSRDISDRVELERSAALLSAEVQARAVALADLVTLKREVEHERALRLELQQQVQRSRELGDTPTPPSPSAASPLQQGLGHSRSGRILPSPSNCVDAAEFGGGTGGGWRRDDSWLEQQKQTADEAKRTATGGAAHQANGDTAVLGGDGGDLIVVRDSRRRPKDSTRSTSDVPGKQAVRENALARTLWEEQLQLFGSEMSQK